MFLRESGFFSVAGFFSGSRSSRKFTSFFFIVLSCVAAKVLFYRFFILRNLVIHNIQVAFVDNSVGNTTYCVFIVEGLECVDRRS